MDKSTSVEELYKRHPKRLVRLLAEGLIRELELHAKEEQEREEKEEKERRDRCLLWRGLVTP